MKDKWNVNQLVIMLNQEKARLKQLEQHSIYLINQGAERKLRKPKKGLKHGLHKTSVVSLKRRKMAIINVTFVIKSGNFKKDCPKYRQI